MDLWGWSRSKTVLVNFFVILLISVPCVVGFGVDIPNMGTIQDLEDFIVSDNLLPLGSLIYLFFCTSRYGWGWDNFLKEANSGKGLKFPKANWLRLYIKYILPLIVLFVFVMGYINKFGGN